MPSKKLSWLILALVLVFSMVLAACGPAATEETTTEVTTGETTGTDGVVPADYTGTVEVFSWWTGGGEAAGLEAMIAVFNAAYPNIEFVNSAVAGGAGTNARAVLATRLQAGDPPDSWQGHAGQELIGTYVAAGQIEPLNFLYEQNGWLDVMPETLIPLISQDGNIYSVPVNIHRANVMWYNPTVLSDAGIDPASLTSVDAFIAALQTLRDGGMEAPLAMGEQWTAMHLMETIFLATLGPDAYNGLWDGTTDWGSAEVTTAIENYATVLGYVNSDASALTWQDASQLVVNGDAAFNVMGDWAEGYFKELGLSPDSGTDFGWMPVPGTQGSFQFLSDSFVLAVGAPDREAALAWLNICGSQAGQDAFNPVKGSIPARSDADVSLYDTYLQSAMADWASNTIVGSLTHGVVANDSWKTLINDALGVYLTDTTAVETFQASLVTACQTAGPCQ
jgi:glucose/mannose transport system substrate-binding protein